MRSLLFVPADSERKIVKGLASKADAVILDLEDSVAGERKVKARELVCETLANRPKDGPLIYVRVNPLSSGLTAADLKAVSCQPPDGIIQPKTVGGWDVTELATQLPASVPIVAIATETARSIFHLDSYHGCADRLYGLSWGAEDLSNDLGATASRNGDGCLTHPYQLARSLCLIGARAIGVEPIDTVYVNFRDTAGLQAECLAAARDGFTGKLAIHPDQVGPINQAFTPSQDAVARAERIVALFEAAGDVGVADFAGEMLDRPHLLRAQKLLERAKNYIAPPRTP